MKNIPHVMAISAVVSILTATANVPGDVTESDTEPVVIGDPVERIAELSRQILAERRAALKVLRQCDEEIERYHRLPPNVRTREDERKAYRAETIKLKSFGALAGSHFPEGIDYMRENFFYMSPATAFVKYDGVFGHFPCARALAMRDELSAVRIVISLVKHTELTPSEQIVCATFLYEIAKNPDRQNALGKNLLLKEVEDLRNRIRTSKPDMARMLEDNLVRLDRRVQGVLICYDRILEDEDQAMRQFSDASGEMLRANRRKWQGQQP